MSLDTTRSASRAERLTAYEARQRLGQERASRLAQLDAIKETGHEETDRLMAAQKSAVLDVLKEIDAAFDRVADGSYGTCQGCGKPIPVERLEILPYTRCCVTCLRRTA
ncbi:TraR/DksA C4-type zinc finger protein [Streptomyces macrosporus]|uniref:TraR/DksA C4-type zinc finger protein n=1 Tax=Streptomyces macrosporus TaxID=44032 RepID=A0ABN3JHV2_9ACTN